LVSDIEFLNFEGEGEFKKYRLNARNLNEAE